MVTHGQLGGDVAVASARYDRVIRPLYLPGDGPPDEWVYTVLEADPARCAVDLGAPWLAALPIRRCEHFDNPADKPANITAFRRSGGPPTTQARGHCAQGSFVGFRQQTSQSFCRSLGAGIWQCTVTRQLKGLCGAAWAIVACSRSAHHSPTLQHPQAMPPRKRARTVFLDQFNTAPRVTRASVLERNAWRENLGTNYYQPTEAKTPQSRRDRGVNLRILEQFISIRL